MKKIKLILLITIFSIALVGCGRNNDEETINETVEESVDNAEKETIEESNEITSSEMTKDFIYVDKGSVYINNEGKLVEKTNISDKKIVELYSEPRCPGCINVEMELKDNYSEFMGENTLLRFYPLTFIGKNPDNEEFVTYSDNLSAIYLAIAEIDPQIFTKYTSKTMDHVFATLYYEESETAQLKAFEEAYKEVGGENWEKIQELIPQMRLITNIFTGELIRDDDLISKIPDGRLATPLLWIVGSDQTTPINDENSEDIVNTLREVLK